jgi:hypothetical protein
MDEAVILFMLVVLIHPSFIVRLNGLNACNTKAP